MKIGSYSSIVKWAIKYINLFCDTNQNLHYQDAKVPRVNKAVLGTSHICSIFITWKFTNFHNS